MLVETARAIMPPADEPIILVMGIVFPSFFIYLIALYAPMYATPFAPPPWKAKLYEDWGIYLFLFIIGYLNGYSVKPDLTSKRKVLSKFIGFFTLGTVFQKLLWDFI